MHQHSVARFDHSTFGHLNLFRISSFEFLWRRRTVHRRTVAPSHRRTV